ncbi:MAG: aconitase/3-isopropylmalate dehydratase large subunit family protein [Candidatus Edwardsbacteria bacterium]
MRQTIIEKILSKASGKQVKVGERIWAKLDLVTMRDFGGPNVVQEYKSAFGNKLVFDGKKVAITFDLHIPPRDEKVARNQQICREFVRETGAYLFEVNTGVGQHILFEQGLVKPWDVIVGTDSHMNLLGVFGAFATGVGTTDIAAGLAYGKLWYKVPETHKYIIEGELPKWTSAKDVILHTLKEVRTDGAIYKAIEFTGSTVEKMSLAERITLTSMVTEISGKVGFIEPNKEILKFVERRSGERVEPINADVDAQYEKIIRFDVSKLEPQIACPHSPDNVKPVKELVGQKIDQVFIGSCTNGRYEDLEIAAKILKGNKAKARLIIVPATMEVAREALRNKLYEIFLSAGAVVTNPGCALCTTGHPGILAPGEIMVSTSNRNFIGKLGKDAFVYLASPATAAACAITGEITDPRT